MEHHHALLVSKGYHKVSDEGGMFGDEEVYHHKTKPAAIHAGVTNNGRRYFTSTNNRKVINLNRGGGKMHKNVHDAVKMNEEVLSFKQFVEAATPKGNFSSKTSNLLGSDFKSERDSFGGQRWMHINNVDNSHMPDLHKHLVAHGFQKHKTHRDGSIYLNGKREVEVLHQGNRVHSVELK